MIAVGDFCQLPPADNSRSFVFETAAWRNLDFVNVVLKHVWRQKDPTFVNMLNELRFGKVSDATVARLQVRQHTFATLSLSFAPPSLSLFAVFFRPEKLFNQGRVERNDAMTENWETTN